MLKYNPTILITLILALALASLPVPAFIPDCAANPFKGGDGQRQVENTGQEPTFLNAMLRHIAAAQKDIRARMVALSSDMKENPFGASFRLFMGLAFVYGIVHALGPGHGKFVVFSYLTGRSGDLLLGLSTGCALAAAHVLSAVAIILAFLALYGRASHTSFEKVMVATELFSYALIAVMGAGLTFLTLKRLRSGGKMEDKKQQTSKSLGVALAAGLVPCPGAAIILLFSLSMGIFMQGLMAMSALAAGMAISISAAALLAVAGNRSISNLAAGKVRLLKGVYAVLTVAGAAAMACFGLMMFLERL